MVPDAPLLARQNQNQNCIQCADPPPCNCSSNEQCVLVNRDCFTCPANTCVPADNASGSKGGVSAGAVAGAVVAVVVFLVAVVLVFLWYRRRSKRLQTTPGESGKTDSPARAEDVLNRPDPNEKPPSPLPTIRETSTNGGNVPAAVDGRNSSAIGTQGHASRQSAHSNPFSDRLDNQSIQTAGSVGTQSNVIPIALVGPDAASALSNPTTAPSTQATAGTAPSRPDRDPELNLNIDHNAQGDANNARAESYTASQVSGNFRHSYMTTGSYASDLLSEAPIIVTPGRGAIKQVLGVVKAEVIRTPAGSSVSGDSPPHTADSLRPAFTNRPPTRSPLAASSFGPSDILSEEHSQHVDMKGDPFGDEHSPYIVTGSQTSSPSSPTPSASTFGSPALTPSQYSSQPSSEWAPEDPSRPWAGSSGHQRPDSMSTQAGSVIGATVGAATRMYVGNILAPPSSSSPDTPVSATLSSPRTPYRMTSAKLVSPLRNAQTSSPASPNGGAFEMQQRRALEELDAARRDSRASIVSSTSTRADSILESFPFVPPSPISDRPLRTPPRSPLAQQAFSDNSPVATPQPKTEPEPRSEPQPAPQQPESRLRKKSNNLPPPPSIMNNRKMLGMSVASETSTMSNGLGSFPFQIDSGSISESTVSSPQPQSINGRQRASLDTLALTSDLASYPLGLDQNIMNHYPGPKR